MKGNTKLIILKLPHVYWSHFNPLIKYYVTWEGNFQDARSVKQQKTASNGIETRRKQTLLWHYGHASVLWSGTNTIKNDTGASLILHGKRSLFTSGVQKVHYKPQNANFSLFSWFFFAPSIILFHRISFVYVDACSGRVSLERRSTREVSHYAWFALKGDCCRLQSVNV